MARYLVTGGAGFIGSNIVEELVRRNEEVRVLDNFSTGTRENIVEFINKVELIEGDIRDLKVVRQAVKGVDYVLHQAALPSVTRSVKDPLSINDVNVKGTLNVLISARDAGVKKVVYASSSSIYGDSEVLPKKENMTPNPKSPYAVSKLAGEHYCKVFSRIYGLPTVCLRYFNVFGPRQDPRSQYAAVIPRFIHQLLNNKLPTIYGDGEQTRDFTYVENVVKANLLAVETNNVSGAIINIACGERFSINRLMQILNEFFQKNVSPIYTDTRPGDVKHSLADINKARRVLAYEPKIKFENGLKMIVDWYKKRTRN